jgi:fluoride exporter
MVYIYVGIGGAIGCLLRYFVSYFTFPTINYFPMGTLFVNMLGSFILGWFVAKVVPVQSVSNELKTGISTGIIGSFTTFSALSIEVIQLIQASRYLWVILYLSISVVCGLMLMSVGYSLGFGKRGKVKDI